MDNPLGTYAVLSFLSRGRSVSLVSGWALLQGKMESFSYNTTVYEALTVGEGIALIGRIWENGRVLRYL